MNEILTQLEKDLEIAERATPAIDSEGHKICKECRFPYEEYRHSYECSGPEFRFQAHACERLPQLAKALRYAVEKMIESQVDGAWETELKEITRILQGEK